MSNYSSFSSFLRVDIWLTVSLHYLFLSPLLLTTHRILMSVSPYLFFASMFAVDILFFCVHLVFMSLLKLHS